jgi:3-mercaptopyruvate sulfurtransferase SseA
MSRGHIPNAIYFDTLNSCQITDVYPRRFPDPNLFQSYVRDNGISMKHHLIIYDRSPFGFMASSRVWLIFRVFDMNLK